MRKVRALTSTLCIDRKGQAPLVLSEKTFTEVSDADAADLVKRRAPVVWEADKAPAPAPPAPSPRREDAAEDSATDRPRRGRSEKE